MDATTVINVYKTEMSYMLVRGDALNGGNWDARLT